MKQKLQAFLQRILKYIKTNKKKSAIEFNKLQMKIVLKTVIIISFLIIGCKSNKTNFARIDSVSNIDTTTLSVNIDTANNQNIKEFEKEKVINIDSVLKANRTIEIEFQDSLVYVLGNRGFFGKSNGQIVTFTKLKDDSDVFAIVYPSTYDDESMSNVLFYIRKNYDWILVSKFETNDVIYFETLDVNNDGVREIQVIGHPNMNGNWPNTFYSYSETENKFIDGGGFFSSMYEFKPQLSKIEVEYGGSWYMPNSKTIYYWKNQKLVTYKEVEIGLKKADMRHNAMYIKYSENLTLEKDSAQLVYKKSFRGKNLNQFYDNFFENN
jgi:uncharacterized protein YcfL